MIPFPTDYFKHPILTNKGTTIEVTPNPTIKFRGKFNPRQ